MSSPVRIFPAETPADVARCFTVMRELRPHLRTAEDFTAAVEALGPVDVLCSHAPPAVAELAYDVVSRRAEASSPALLAKVRRDRPRASVFGHVHQPLAARVRVGPTECVNVGHFRRTGVPYVLRW